jgi:hypothetical protein
VKSKIKIVAALVVGCSGSVETDESIGVTQDPIINGSPGTPDYTSIVKVSPSFGGGVCTGALVTNWAVVTAAHCVDDLEPFWGALVTMGTQGAVSQHIFLHPNHDSPTDARTDVAVILLYSPLRMYDSALTLKPYGFSRGIFRGAKSELLNTWLIQAGYGLGVNNDCSRSTLGQYRSAIVTSGGDDARGVPIIPNSDGQIGAPGDSGAGLFSFTEGWPLASIQSTCFPTSTCPGVGDHVWAPTLCMTHDATKWRDWADKAIYGRLIPQTMENFGSTTSWPSSWYGRDAAGAAAPNWSIQNGVLTEPSNMNDGNATTAWPAEGSFRVNSLMTVGDGLASVLLRATTDNDSSGLIFRLVDVDNYYRVSVDAERKFLRIARKKDGIWTNLSSLNNFIFNYSVDHRLTVVLKGSKIEVHWDGVIKLTTNDTSFGYGGVGVYQWGQAPARFDDLIVQGF